MKKKTQIYIHTKLHDVDDIPRDPEQLKNWIYQRFHEKDMILENFKVHGKLPTDQPPTQQSLFALDFILFYSMYLISLYSFVISPLSSLITKFF